jgi:hypothetical protein
LLNNFNFNFNSCYFPSYNYGQIVEKAMAVYTGMADIRAGLRVLELSYKMCWILNSSSSAST